MITKRPVKIIKRQEADTREQQVADESAAGANIWSKSVRLWVDQYRQASAKRPPAFDRLFKDSLPVERPIAVND